MKIMKEKIESSTHGANIYFKDLRFNMDDEIKEMVTNSFLHAKLKLQVVCSVGILLYLLYVKIAIPNVQ